MWNVMQLSQWHEMISKAEIEISLKFATLPCTQKLTLEKKKIDPENPLDL